MWLTWWRCVIATQEEIIRKIGSHLLFLGVETLAWNDAQWSACAVFCRSHGVDSAVIKIADGGNKWFSDIAAFEHVVSIFASHGVGAIPYMYSYANVFSYLDGEIDTVMIPYLQRFGTFCLDAEKEYNNNVAAAARVAEKLKPVAGTFLVSTWADPREQSFIEVAKAFAPATDYFLPQQYNNWLGSQRTQWGNIGPIQPTLNLDSSFGTNDAVLLAKTAYAQGSRILSIWEYAVAVNNPTLLDAVLNAFPRTQVNTHPITTNPPVAKPVPNVPTYSANMRIPTGWHDDGKTLTAPNGHKVVDGCRIFVLTNDWNANDWPLQEEQARQSLELSNPSLGNGTQQIFRMSMLGYTPQRGVFVEWIGQELIAVRAKLGG